MEEFGPLQYQHGLAWREIGQGTPLVLLHGGSGSRTHWIRNMPALAQRFRVVTVDLPGFGESAAPAAGMGVADYVDWFADALAARLDGRPFHMAAFSFGAALGCAALARRPFDLRRLSLLGPAGYGRPTGRELGLRKMPGRNAGDEAVRQVAAENLGRLMLATPPGPDDAVVDLQLRNLARTRYDSRAVSLGETILDDLQSVDADVQVIWGEQDRLPSPSLAEREAGTAAAIPGARLRRIAGAGHWVQYEASDAVNRVLTTFHAGED